MSSAEGTLIMQDDGSDTLDEDGRDVLADGESDCDCCPDGDDGDCHDSCCPLYEYSLTPARRPFRLVFVGITPYESSAFPGAFYNFSVPLFVEVSCGAYTGTSSDDNKLVRLPDGSYRIQNASLIAPTTSGGDDTGAKVTLVGVGGSCPSTNPADWTMESFDGAGFYTALGNAAGSPIPEVICCAIDFTQLKQDYDTRGSDPTAWEAYLGALSPALVITGGIAALDLFADAVSAGVDDDVTGTNPVALWASTGRMILPDPFVWGTTSPGGDYLYAARWAYNYSSGTTPVEDDSRGLTDFISMGVPQARVSLPANDPYGTQDPDYDCAIVSATVQFWPSMGYLLTVTGGFGVNRTYWKLCGGKETAAGDYLLYSQPSEVFQYDSGANPPIKLTLAEAA